MTIILFSSCEKGNTLLKGTGTLKNLTGFDGCGWVIQFDQSGTTKTLEPTNLSDFNVILDEGKKVDFFYYKTTSPSICMVGDVIKLTSLTNN
ncbi:MAG: hypothetical protein H7098_04895 [Oligoflexus sp.]|nr:hypothetical protein [Pseudopedobacter sp.]